MFRQEFLEDTIGLTPAQGYQPARDYSTMALQLLAWIHHQTGDQILHALDEGEYGVRSKTKLVFRLLNPLLGFVSLGTEFVASTSQIVSS